MNASNPTMISTARLTQLCDLRETRLRELAAQGWIPKPHRRQHPLTATIHGLLRYYRERHEGGAVKPVYESFEQCSAALGISVTELKRAKRKGCPALRYNRVHLKAYLHWRFAAENRGPVVFDRGRIERVLLKNAKLRMELQKLRRELIPADTVRRMGAELERWLV